MVQNSLPFSFSNPNLWRRGARLARRWRTGAVCLLALLAVGCSRDKYMFGVVQTFSMNVAPPPGWLGDEKAPLAPAEKEILAQRGRPDFLRYWWNNDGRPVKSSDFAGRGDQFPELIKAVKKSWIYLKGDEGEEIVFLNGGASYSARPMTDSLKLLCKYGDPGNRTEVMNINGERRETWTWMDHGMQVELVDGRIKNTKNFQGTGTGTYLLK